MRISWAGAALACVAATLSWKPAVGAVEQYPFNLVAKETGECVVANGDKLQMGDCPKEPTFILNDEGQIQHVESRSCIEHVDYNPIAPQYFADGNCFRSDALLHYRSGEVSVRSGAVRMTHLQTISGLHSRYSDEEAPLADNEKFEIDIKCPSGLWPVGNSADGGPVSSITCTPFESFQFYVYVSEATGKCLVQGDSAQLYTRPCDMVRDEAAFAFAPGFSNGKSELRVLADPQRCFVADWWNGAGYQAQSCSLSADYWRWEPSEGDGQLGKLNSGSNCAKSGGFVTTADCDDDGTLWRRIAPLTSCPVGEIQSYNPIVREFSCVPCASGKLASHARVMCGRETVMSVDNAGGLCMAIDRARGNDIFSVGCDTQVKELARVVFDGYHIRLAGALNLCIVPDPEDKIQKGTSVTVARCSSFGAGDSHWTLDDSNRLTWSDSLGARFCLDASANSDNIHLWTCHSNANQRWHFVDAPEPCASDNEVRVWESAPERRFGSCAPRDPSVCPVGKFWDASSASCKSCPRGTFTVRDGETRCEPLLVRGPVRPMEVFSMVSLSSWRGNPCVQVVEGELRGQKCSVISSEQLFSFDGKQLRRASDPTRCFAPDPDRELGKGLRIKEVDCPADDIAWWALTGENGGLRWLAHGQSYCPDVYEDWSINMHECDTVNNQKKWAFRRMRAVGVLESINADGGPAQCVNVSAVDSGVVDLAVAACETNSTFEFDGLNLGVVGQPGCLHVDGDNLELGSCAAGMEPDVQGWSFDSGTSALKYADGSSCLAAEGGKVAVRKSGCTAWRIGIVGSIEFDVVDVVARCNPRAAEDFALALEDGMPHQYDDVLAADVFAVAECVREWRARGGVASEGARARAADRLVSLVADHAAGSSDAHSQALWIQAAVLLAPYPGNDRAVNSGSFTSTIAPPAPLVDLAGDVDDEWYSTTFTDRLGLQTTCVDLIRDMTKCGCSLRVDGDGNCVLVNDYKASVRRGLTLAYCASHVDLIGSGLSLDLMARSAACLRARVDTLSWQPDDPRFMLSALESVRDIANAAGSDRYVSSKMRSDYHAIAAAVASHIDNLRADVLLVTRYNATTLLRVANPATRVSADLLHGELGTLAIRADLAQMMTSLGKLINASNTLLLQRIDGSVAALGELVFDTASEVDAAAADRYKESIAIMKSETKAQIEEAESKVATLEDRLEALDSKFIEVTGRIKEQRGDLDGAIEKLERSGTGLGEIIKDFLDCVASDKLNELARERMFAIFNIVVGAVQAIGEVAACVVSAGASTGLTVGAKAAVNAAKFVSKVARSPGRSFKSAKDKLRTLLKEGSPDLPVIVLRNKKDVNEAVEKLENWNDLKDNLGNAQEILGEIKGLEDLDFSSLKGWADAVQTGLSLAGDLGVPGAAGAARIMGGVETLINHEANRQAVKDEHKNALEAVEQTFVAVSAIVEEIAEFTAVLVLEFHDVLAADAPPTGPSKAGSSSTTRWRLMGNKIIDLLKGAPQFKEIQDAAAATDSRLLSDRSALRLPGGAHGSDDAAVDAGSALQARRAAAGASGVSPAPDIRRALKNKDGGEGPTCGSSTTEVAQTALSKYDVYFQALGDVVFFGETMHSNMVELIGLSREVKVQRVAYAGAVSTAAAWEETGALLDNVEPGDAGDQLRAKYAEFLAKLPSLSNAKPVLSWNAPNASLLLLDEVQLGGRIREGCSLPPIATFRTVELPEGEDLHCYIDDPLALLKVGSRGSNAVSDYAAEIQVEVREAARQMGAWAAGSDAFRIPVGSVRDIRLRYSTNGAVPGDAKIELDLRDPGLPILEELGDCLVNYGVINAGVLLENVTNPERTRPLYPIEEDDEWSFDAAITQSGPFVQVVDSEEGRVRHLVNYSTPPESLLATMEITKDKKDCSSNAGRFEFGDNTYEACFVDDRNSYDIPLVPFLSLFTIDYLPDTLIDMLNAVTRDDEENVELVLYAHVHVSNEVNKDKCGLRVDYVSPLRPPDAFRVHPGLAAGAATAVVLVLSVLVFAAFRRSRRSARGSAGEDRVVVKDGVVSEESGCSKTVAPADEVPQEEA